MTGVVLTFPRRVSPEARLGAAMALQAVAADQASVGRVAVETFEHHGPTLRTAQAALVRDPKCGWAPVDIAHNRRLREVALDHQRRAAWLYREARAVLGQARDFFGRDGRCLG